MELQNCGRVMVSGLWSLAPSSDPGNPKRYSPSGSIWTKIFSITINIWTLKKMGKGDISNKAAEMPGTDERARFLTALLRRRRDRSCSFYQIVCQ
jgi:hypothetical protein